MKDPTRSLFRAVKLGDLNAACAAIAAGADLNAKNSMGQGILHYAASQGKEIAELLLDHGAELNCRDFWGRTTLHLAICECNPAVEKLFVSRKADVNAKDNDGNTPLHCAAIHDCVVSTGALIGGGAFIGIRNNAGKLPLDLASGETRKLLKIEAEISEFKDAWRKFSFQKSARSAFLPKAVPLLAFTRGANL
ncbi:Putative ankyrin repeat protein [uncultured archaeon]|nr:Putative ankyrin repeat protein [uncultured archaeon]